MSKIKVNVEVDDCNENSNNDPNVGPNAAGDLFYMTFAASDNIKTDIDQTKTWYLNPGNISEASWVTWNPMPWPAKLVEIKVTMSPDFDAGVARWAIMKNSAEQPDYLNIPPNQSKASRTLDIDFGIDEYIGLSLQLQNVITDTWPAAVLIFKRL